MNGAPTRSPRLVPRCLRQLLRACLVFAGKSDAMLVVEQLQRLGFGPFDLTVAPGECVGIAGPSGAGKSVFLRMIADLDPHAGSVRFDDTRCADMPAPAWRRLVAYVPAESGWWAERVGEHFADRAAATA